MNNSTQGLEWRTPAKRPNLLTLPSLCTVVADSAAFPSRPARNPTIYKLLKGIHTISLKYPHTIDEPVLEEGDGPIFKALAELIWRCRTGDDAITQSSEISQQRPRPGSSSIVLSRRSAPNVQPDDLAFLCSTWMFWYFHHKRVSSCWTTVC